MKVMESEGVVGECIYPTKSLYLWNMDDEETGITCARIYNDWIYDLLESRSERFRCAAVIPTWSIEAAMAEVERTAAKGLAAMMLPLVGTPEFNHDRWKPLWSLIEETGCPVVMHQGSGHDMLFYRGPGASVSNLLATQSMAPRTAGLLTMAGVLENHPDLHFVFVETNAAWISWAMGTLDHYDEAFRKNVNWVRPALKEKPSFYIKRQIHGSFQRDETAVRNIPITGPQVALWGSDWPHEEGTYPNSQAVVAEMADMVSKEDLDAMVFGVAADLFKFDKEKLLEPF